MEEEKLEKSFSIRREQTEENISKRLASIGQLSLPSQQNYSREQELLDKGEIYTMFTALAAAGTTT